jgi:hypothetical protein
VQLEYNRQPRADFLETLPLETRAVDAEGRVWGSSAAR